MNQTTTDKIAEIIKEQLDSTSKVDEKIIREMINASIKIIAYKISHLYNEKDGKQFLKTAGCGE